MGVDLLGTGSGGDVGLDKGFWGDVEGLERGLKLLSSLGESCFYDLLSVGPDIDFGPGDWADMKDG